MWISVGRNGRGSSIFVFRIEYLAFYGVVIPRKLILNPKEPSTQVTVCPRLMQGFAFGTGASKAYTKRGTSARRLPDAPFFQTCLDQAPGLHRTCFEDFQGVFEMQGPQTLKVLILRKRISTSTGRE